MTTALPEVAPRKSLHRCTPERRFRWAPEHLRGGRGVDKDKEGKSETAQRSSSSCWSLRRYR